MPTMKQRVICKSGHSGWRDRLRSNYNNFDCWKAYSELYGLHTKLGYQTPQEAWDENPLIEGSIFPEDFRKVS